MRKIGRERGWPAPTREQFDLLCGPRGALLVGDPKTVAEKILFQYDIFGNTRYLIYFSGMPHRTTMRASELLGTQVAPLVRAGLVERARARFDAIGSVAGRAGRGIDVQLRGVRSRRSIPV
jgi:hypothetical protein